jgi:hypothetical protein
MKMATNMLSTGMKTWMILHTYPTMFQAWSSRHQYFVQKKRYVHVLFPSPVKTSILRTIIALLAGPLLRIIDITLLYVNKNVVGRSLIILPWQKHFLYGSLECQQETHIQTAMHVVNLFDHIVLIQYLDIPGFAVGGNGGAVVAVPLTYVLPFDTVIRNLLWHDPVMLFALADMVGKIFMFS